MLHQSITQLLGFCVDILLLLAGDCGVDHPGSSPLKPTSDGLGKVNSLLRIPIHAKFEDDVLLSRESENSEDVSLKKQVI